VERTRPRVQFDAPSRRTSPSRLSLPSALKEAFFRQAVEGEKRRQKAVQGGTPTTVPIPFSRLRILSVAPNIPFSQKLLPAKRLEAALSGSRRLTAVLKRLNAPPEGRVGTPRCGVRFKMPPGSRPLCSLAVKRIFFPKGGLCRTKPDFSGLFRSAVRQSPPEVRSPSAFRPVSASARDAPPAFSRSILALASACCGVRAEPIAALGFEIALIIFSLQSTVNSHTINLIRHLSHITLYGSSNIYTIKWFL
jgi:hypothetical protein